MKTRFLTISIVTLSFNQSSFLKEALASVIDQQYPSLEYIVVDPGSTDGSRQMIDEFKSHLSCVILEPDKGASDGLNKGFAHATGEILGFLNADDLLLPNSLAAINDYFISHPEIDIVVGNGFVIDESRRPVKHVIGTGFSTHSFLHGGASWIQQSVFFRKEAFRRTNGFNRDNRTSWDGELFLHMLRNRAKVGYLKADIGCFRIHRSSITGGGVESQKRFLVDRDRMFKDTYGRDWNLIDELTGLLYRCKLLLSQPSRIHFKIQNRLGIVPK